MPYQRTAQKYALLTAVTPSPSIKIVPFYKNLERDNFPFAYIEGTPTVSIKGGMGDAQLAEKSDAEGIF
jgi:hypothetical protein